METTDKVVRVELEFDMNAQRLNLRSKTSTIGIEGALLAAAIDKAAAIRGGRLPADKVVRVSIAYDLETDDCTVETNCPRVVVLGVIMRGLGAINRNQITQNLQNQFTALERRIIALEAPKA